MSVEDYEHGLVIEYPQRAEPVQKIGHRVRFPPSKSEAKMQRMAEYV